MEWENKIEERTNLFTNLPYTLENHELLDKIMVNSPKIWEGFEKIKKLIQDEDASSYGGAQESLTEQGII